MWGNQGKVSVLAKMPVNHNCWRSFCLTCLKHASTRLGGNMFLKKREQRGKVTVSSQPLLDS